ncbi:cache domain-containing protein [Dyadobacter chenwenxiniae]|uniref:Cache domain-containing protein n=1 Tax=Dyadobacter chenwenxiniae TaxID=2906456 RepID=A0A9X1PFU5_9BACT|nr:cache domain-containing protein [Dyadobacter chenwenxiniae]MCF0060577.1 cache domain-containing protein [Dyadobacter chenwenxiniae]UON86308.1 cache domain-containing protein [Dyadobacter chenwenxiniae]
MNQEAATFSLSNFFSLDRKQIVILMTILSILVTAALYLFIYIPSNQRNVEAIRFRAIQNIDKNIGKKVDNSVMLMNQLLAYQQNKDTVVASYIKSFPKNDFELSEVKPDDSFPLDTRGDNLRKISFDDENVKIRLQNDNLSIQMKYTLQKFIEPLLSKDAFDNYLLIDERGRIIYQTFHSGAIVLPMDSIESNYTGFKNKNVRDIRLGGVDYKIFLQKIKLAPTKFVTIAGLLNKQKYQHLNTSLPENMVVFILFILLALILSFPWIKLYQIGNQDRLTVFDGLFAFVSSLLLLAFLVFAFLNYNGIMQPGERSSKISSRNLANGLKTAFESDITKAFNVLSSIDSLRIKNNINRNLSNISADIKSQNAVTPVKLSDKTAKAALQPLISKLIVEEVFWLDRKGWQIYNYNKTTSAPSASYADRSYYKQLSDNRPYHLENGSGFGLEQVVSWTTGSFVTVVSKKVEGDSAASYAAIAFNPKSVARPLLPAGFTFAIIDKEGNVLYHSNPFKNLNENLIQEFYDTDLLREGLRGTEDFSMKTKYSGKESNVYISPFSRLPYYMVVFEDTGFNSARDTKVFVFTFTLLFLFFLFLAIHFVVIYLLYQRPSFLKKHYFDIAWLGPNKKFRPRYILVFVFNCVIIVLLIPFACFASFMQFLFIMLLSATAVSIFLNIQYNRSYFKNEAHKFRQKEKAIKTLFGIAGVIIIAAAVNTDFNCFLYFTIIISVFGFFYTKLTVQTRHRRRLVNLASNFRVSHCFTAMVFTRLLIMSALPVAYFFISAYNYESSLIGTYRHKQFNEEFVRRGGVKHFGLGTNMFFDNVWIAGLQKPDAIAADMEDMAKRLFEKLGGHIPHDEGVSYTGAQKAGGYARFKGGITTTDFQADNPGFNRLTTEPINYRLPAVVGTNWANWLDWKGVSYWCIFLGALVLFAFILHRIIRKLFALNLPKQIGWAKIDEELLLNNNLNSNLFLIGPFGSNILEMVEEHVNAGKIRGPGDEKLAFGGGFPWTKNAHIADMLMIPDNEEDAKTDKIWLGIQASTRNKNYKLIIVNHFEYDLHNMNTNRIKLNFLESLLHKTDCKIIIVSTVHPINFLDSLNQAENKKPVGQRQPEHDLERWHLLLCHFRIIVRGIADGRKSRSATTEWQKTIKSELRYGSFLNEMRNPAMKVLTQMSNKNLRMLDGDSLDFKMEITSHYYYMGLWQSLTKEEKFILYDLAEDGLVNPFDEHNLSLLILKGLILQDDSGLRIFNVGFRHFILTSIGTGEVMKIRSQIRDNGAWNSLRIPLIILIVAVFAFLFASQQEAYETLLKYLSVLTISVPTALKFFAMFEKTPKNN